MKKESWNVENSVETHGQELEPLLDEKVLFTYIKCPLTIDQCAILMMTLREMTGREFFAKKNEEGIEIHWF